MLKAVIFDLDNTIYSYQECHEYATDKVYEYVNNLKEISKEEFLKRLDEAKKIIKNNLGNTASSHSRILYFQNMLEKLDINPINRADKMYEIYWDNFFDIMKLRKGTQELFDYLKENNIKIALCTDLTTYLQFKKIKKLGIDSYIDYIVTSEEAGIEKPNEKMFNMVIDKISIDKSECIYIGDDYKKDIEGAEKAGIKAIQIKEDFIDIIKEIERSV